MLFIPYPEIVLCCKVFTT